MISHRGKKGINIRALLWRMLAIGSHVKGKRNSRRKALFAKHFYRCWSLDMRQLRNWMGKPGDMRKIRTMLFLLLKR